MGGRKITKKELWAIKRLVRKGKSDLFIACVLNRSVSFVHKYKNMKISELDKEVKK